MTKCITCGDELHPERAKKYDYCMKPECQAKNLKGLTMVAVGVNKSAEQYLLLDEDTKTDLARGKYHDQQRAAPSASPPGPRPAQDRQPGEPHGRARPGGPNPGQPSPGQPPAGASPTGISAPQGGAGEARPGLPRAAAAAGHRVTAAPGGPVQPAGPAAGRDHQQARAEPVRRHADHPGRTGRG